MTGDRRRPQLHRLDSSEDDPLQDKNDPLSRSYSSDHIDDDDGVLHHPNLPTALRWLYVTHASRQFIDGAWQFCVVLILLELSNNSLFWVSTYGLTIQAVVGLGTPWTGKHWIDESDGHRLTIVRNLIVGAHGCVLLAATCLYFQYLLNPIALLLSIHVLGAMEQILVQTLRVAMERDWMVVMITTGNNKQQQQQPSFDEGQRDDTADRFNLPGCSSCHYWMDDVERQQQRQQYHHLDLWMEYHRTHHRLYQAERL